MNQVTLPVDIPPFFLSQTQPQRPINSSTNIKRPFMSSLPSLLMPLQLHSLTWSHQRWFPKWLLPSIPLTYLIPIIYFWNIMRYWSSTSWAYFSTTKCHPLLRPISHPIPTVFKHPSHMPFHHKGLTQFQLLPTGNLQVTCLQPFHLRLLQKSHMRILSQIHPMPPVNTKYPSSQALQYNTQGWHSSHPHKIHLIKLALILHHN